MLLSGRLVRYSHNRTFVFHQAYALIIDFREKNGNQSTACSMLLSGGPYAVFESNDCFLSTKIKLVYGRFILIQAYIDKLVSKDLYYESQQNTLKKKVMKSLIKSILK